MSKLLQLEKANCDVLLKYFKEGCVALDVETTGLSPLSDYIIELSAVKVKANGDLEFFENLICPPIPIPPFTTRIHHISDMMVSNKPKIIELLPAFINFIGDLPLIAHNAQFDMGFLASEASRHQLKFNKNPVHCSVLLARKAFPHLGKYKLNTLAEALNIQLFNHHRATDDAWASLIIFAKSLIELNKAEKPFSPQPVFQLQKLAISTTSIPENLKLLQGYIANGSLLEIEYDGGSRRGQMRPIRPIGLLPSVKGNVLYAECLLSDKKTKSFVLKKIKDFRLIKFAENEDLVSYLKNNYEVVDEKDKCF